MSKKTTARKAEQVKRQKESERETILAKVRDELAQHPHIKLISRESLQWKALVEADPAYKLAWTPVANLIKENKHENVYDTFEGMEKDEIRDLIFAHLSDPMMMPIEKKFYDKFGSFWQPDFSTWSEKVFELYKHTTWNPHEEVLERAMTNVIIKLKSAAIKLNGSGRLTPLSLSDAYQRIPKGKNSGYPFFTSRWARESNEHMAKYYLEEAELMLKGEDRLNCRPFVLFKRIQALSAGDLPKMRPIQGAPKEDAIASKTITAPLVDLFKSMDQFVGFNGGERVGGYVKSKMMKYSHLISADFSAFDANAQEIVAYAFRVIKALFPKETHAYLDNTMCAYQSVKLITPLGIIYSDKINGVASGCGMTSILGTICNAICVEYAMIRLGIGDYMALSFGDDIALGTNKLFSLEEFGRVMSEVGMECNPLKQEVSDEYFSFLGYYHFRSDTDDIGKFPIMRLAPGLKYKERHPRLSEILSEFEGKDGYDNEEEIDKIKEEVGHDQLNAMGIACKLNVARGHDDFEIICDLVKRNAPFLTEENLKPLMKYRHVLRSHRTSRSAEFPVITALFGAASGYENRITNRMHAELHRTAIENGWEFCVIKAHVNETSQPNGKSEKSANKLPALDGNNPLLDLLTRDF